MESEEHPRVNLRQLVAKKRTTCSSASCSSGKTTTTAPTALRQPLQPPLDIQRASPITASGGGAGSQPVLKGTKAQGGSSAGVPSLRQQWEKHNASWQYIMQCKRPDGSCFDCFEAQPDVAQPFGIRCVVCSEACQAGVIKPSRWTVYGHKGVQSSGSLGKLQVEELKRHCNVSASQASGTVPRSKPHDLALASKRLVQAAAVDVQASIKRRKDTSETATTYVAPSAEQIRICVELAWGWGGTSLNDYERRCTTAREQGADIPHVRSSPKSGRAILISACEYEFRRDRTIYIPQAVEIAWAQDKTRDWLYMDYKTVNSDFEVHDRMVDILRASGDRSLQCAHDMERALNRLCSEVHRERQVPNSVGVLSALPAAPGAVALGCGSASQPASQQVDLGGASREARLPPQSADCVDSADRHAPQPRATFTIMRTLQPLLKEQFQAKCRNANADGAAEEQLALRLSKACKTLPCLDFITRAEEHSCVLVMNHAGEKCGWLQPLCFDVARMQLSFSSSQMHHHTP
jgi:hypothetical protein